MKLKYLSISEAARVIQVGGVVAFPTETFYGLAAHPQKAQALKKIFRIKGREKNKPLLLVISSPAQVKKWAVEVSGEAKKLMNFFWPGPLTLVFKSQKNVLPELTGGSKTVGLRLSASPIARNLAGRCGGAITATSANISGQEPSAKGPEVWKSLGTFLDGIMAPNRSKIKSKGSTILDVSRSKINVLREGDLSLVKIQKILGE